MPARIAGLRFGKMIRRKVVSGPAPSEAAASSISRSSSSSTGCTARTTNGRVTKSSATTQPDPREGDVDPDRAVGAVEGQQRDPGHHRRQSEGQVDDRVHDRLAREAVPDQDPGDRRPGDHVDRPRRSPTRPGSSLSADSRERRGDGVPEAAKAALGRLRDQSGDRDQDDQAQVGRDQATPERGAPEARPRDRPRGRLRSGSRSYGRHSVATPRSLSTPKVNRWTPRGPPRSWRRCRCSGSKNSAFAFSQPPMLGSSTVNRPGGVRELVLVLGQHRLVHRPVAAVGPELLGLRSPQELEEVLGLGRGIGRGRGRRLDQDRVVRDHVVDVLAGLLGLDRFALVREQHVALAAGERGQGIARAARAVRPRARAASSGKPAPHPGTCPPRSGRRRRPTGSTSRHRS